MSDMIMPRDILFFSSLSESLLLLTHIMILSQGRRAQSYTQLSAWLGAREREVGRPTCLRQCERQRRQTEHSLQGVSLALPQSDEARRSVSLALGQTAILATLTGPPRHFPNEKGEDSRVSLESL